MEFSYGIYDADGSGITGSTDLKLKIRRQADDYLFDFNTTTFKASGWTTVAATMTQISAANLPGEYKYTVSVLGFDDGMYNAYFLYEGDRPFVDSCEFGVYGGHGLDYNSYNVGGGGGGGGATAGECADAVLDEPMADHQTAGTLGRYIADILGDTDSTLPGLINSIAGADLTQVLANQATIIADTDELQGLISGSKLPAQVKGMDENVLTAAAIAASAVAIFAPMGSEYVQAELTKATAAVEGQGITLAMAADGKVQYVTFKVSKSMNFQTPDVTFYLLYHYDANGDVDMRKPSLTTTW